MKAVVKTEGNFSVEVRDTISGNLVEEKCVKNKNTVTLDGKHYILTKGEFRSGGAFESSAANHPHIQLGTGTVAIDETDTALGGTVKTKLSSNIAVLPTRTDAGGPNDSVTFTSRFRVIFAPGEATGTFGQVGLYRGSLLAGQQLKDINDVPTTLTFLDTEEVTIFYELKHTWVYGTAPNTMLEQPILGSSVVDINGTNHTITIRGPRSLLYQDSGYFTNDNYSVVIGPIGYSSYAGGSTSTNGFVNITRDTIDGPDIQNTSFSYVPFSTAFTTINKGALYKREVVLTLPYNSLQNKFIKALGLGIFVANSGNTLTFNIYRYTSASGIKRPLQHIVEFDPPIYKGEGDELTLTSYYTIEVQ